MRKITSLLLAAVMLFGIITSSGVTAYAASGAENYPLNSIVIKIEDIVTHQMLGGARFEIYYSNEAVSGGYGTLVATVDSDGSGVIVISGIPSGYYIVRQTVPPNNYQLSINNEQHCYIKPDGTSIEELVFSNYRYGGLVVILNDKDTGAPVAGATFSVTDVDNKVVGNHADGIYTTDAQGEFYLENLPAGDYKITQLTAAQGYALDSAPSTRTVRLQHTNADQSVFMAQFSNSPLGTLLVRLKDSISKEPLAGAVFNVKLSGGEDLGEFATDANGSFTLPKIARGTYIISQVSAPSGYLLATSTKTQYVNYVNTYAVDFENQPKSGLYVTKYDKDTKEPLKDAKFQVYQNSTLIGTYTTNADGVFFIPNLNPGWYTISEYAAPQGYILDDTPKSVQVIAETLHRIEFENSKLASLQIIKTDEYNGEPLAGANFRVTTQNGVFVADVTTDGSGKAVIPSLEPGWYVISETKAPTGYLITAAARTVEVKSTVPTVVTITNRAENNLEIVKLDFFSRTPLAGATFKVEHANGANVGTFNTDSAGKILVGNLKEGAYVVSEIKAPDGYQLDSEPQTVVIEGGKLYSVEFLDKPLTAIEIVKTDSVTKLPLAGATFKVERPNGEVIGTYKTDSAGKAIVSDLESGAYIVSETIAPDGYILHETPKTVTVTSGKVTTVEFTNKPYSGIQIIKTDAVTHEPLSGATFEVKRANGETIGTYKTDVSGKVIVSDLEEGTYIVSETIAPDNYILDNAPQTVTVKSGRLTTVEFVNKPFSGIEIRKVDAVSGNALPGAVFEIRKQNGEYVTEVTTDIGGKASIANVEPGWYVLTETKAPQGYVIDGAAKTVEVKTGAPTVVTVSNKPLSGIEIVKLDAVSKAPLMGATFVVERPNGEKIGTYKTDAAGKILVSGLEEGTYIVSETIAPDGYILSEAPKTVVVTSGKLTSVEFTNKPLSGLKVIKLDSATRNPIAGVEFVITKMSGEKVTNDFNGTTFKTDSTGQIYIPGLEDGYYTVTETRSADGYILDGEPKTVQIQSGKPTVLEVLNTPMSGLLIVKTDEATGKPLAGVVFDVSRADGQFVAGSILAGNQPNTEANSPNKTTSTNGDITGSYTTDANGRILINSLPAGEYHVVERKALDGYELDTDVHAATVTPGKLTTLQITNKQKAGLRLLKIDSITKAPIFGVEFMVFDANNKVVGTYITDNNGLIDFSGILTEGRYTIRETRAAAGYYLDDMPRTVEFVSGKITEVRWENTPQQGQIQITKKSGDDNEISGLPAGTPLAGAIFEVYDYKTGNLLDRFTSGTDGRAVSKPLPIGRYTVKEVQAPQYYRLSTQTLDIEIEFATQIIKQEFLNYSANTGVYIKKTGNVEAMPGDTISYTIKEVKNTGTVPLADFYWRDVLPVDAVRLTKLVTGTYNQSLKYKVIATTNKGDTIIIADNLSTTKNNVIDCSNASLGLRSDEFITSVTYVFGNVKAGFCQVEQPQIFVKVLSTLYNGYQFANKCDVGGKYGSEWIVSNSTTLTTIFSNAKLPRTGY